MVSVDSYFIPLFEDDDKPKRMIDLMTGIEFDDVDEYIATLDLCEQEAKELKRILLEENK